MQHSISRMVFLETELSRMRLEPILEDCDEDDTDSLPEQTQLNKEPIESESTLPEVPCPIDDYSTNSNEPSQTDASNILGKLVELPGDNARMQTWLQHLSVRVHGNDPPSSNSAHVGWQTSETQAALSTSGRSSTSKRARKPDSDDEDDNETGGSGRRRKQIPGSGETLIGLLACPFAKFDPLKHVLCWTYADPNTSRLR